MSEWSRLAVFRLHPVPFMPSHRWNPAHGFSLLEVLVATSLVLIGSAALGQLFVVAVRANARGRAMTMSLLLAEQKLEEVVAAFAEQDLAGGISSASPEGALDRSAPSFSDFVDRDGRSLGGGMTPPSGAVYLRRWSIEPVLWYPDSSRVLQVLATPIRDSGDAGKELTRRPETARLITIRTRRSS